jgi:hypothetical protein
MGGFERKMRRAWARDPYRPAECSCQPWQMRWPDGSVVLEHRDWCGLRRRAIGETRSGPATVVLSVRGPGYGEPGYGGGDE